MNKNVFWCTGYHWWDLGDILDSYWYCRINERKCNIFFGKEEYYAIIRSLGRTWNDGKERPIVCLLKLSENGNIYWVIPMTNWEHRNEEVKERIKSSRR